MYVGSPIHALGRRLVHLSLSSLSVRSRAFSHHVTFAIVVSQSNEFAVF